MSQMTPRTSDSRSTQARVVISPATTATPVLTSVSQATRASRVAREDGVQHGIGNLVGHLVRVPFGNRLGSEQVVA